MPMTINSARVDWNEHFDNLPHLVVHVDLMTPHDELVFKRVVHGWDGAVKVAASYWGQDGDFCTFNYWHYNDQRGYGGREFKYRLEDGTVDVVKGPWSSNSLSMNRLFPPCCEVTVKEDKGQFTHLGYHGWCLLLPKFQEVVEGLGCEVAYISDYGRDCELSQEEAFARGYRCGFTIKKKGMTLKDSQEAKRVRRPYADV